MAEACPVPTPAERRYADIQTRIQDAMMQKVYAALHEATEQARREIAAIDPDLRPPSSGYFAAVIHQSMYCTLCGADATTFAGGKAETAVAIIRNAQNIARHYWGAVVDPLPKT